MRAEYKAALDLREQLFTLAQRAQDPALLLVAHDVLGDTLFWLGEFATAREHLEQGIALYNAQQYRSHAFLYGYDSGVACLTFVAHALWHLGYPEQALKRIHEALTLAPELSHPPSLAHALYFAAQLHQYRREGRSAQELAAEVIKVSTDQGFPFWLALGVGCEGEERRDSGRLRWSRR